MRANVFRFALKVGHGSMQSTCLKGANFGSAPAVPLGSAAYGASEAF